MRSDLPVSIAYGDADPLAGDGALFSWWGNATAVPAWPM